MRWWKRFIHDINVPETHVLVLTMHEEALRVHGYSALVPCVPKCSSQK